MVEKSIRKKLMGTAFSLGICADNEETTSYWLAKGVEEIERIEALLSEYQPTSQTTLINQASHLTDISIDKEVFAMIMRCINISKLTNGCFDITSASLKKLYKFTNQTAGFASEKEIGKAMASVGYEKIGFKPENNTIQKLVPNLTISFNAIGKGYAADKVKHLWIANGITSGYINASGDLCAFGTKTDLSPWKVAIADPDKPEKPLFHLPLLNQAIATSGDYEQHFFYQGKRYSHNINPQTGKPIMGIKSVSIISLSAELSDALATAVYVMGVKKGIDFVNQLPQTHSIIIDENNKTFMSKNLKYEAIIHN